MSSSAKLAIFGLLSISPLFLNLILKKKGELDFFSPVICFPIFYFLIYGVGSIRMILDGNENAEKVITLALSGLSMYFLGNFVISCIYKKKLFSNKTTILWNKSGLFLCLFCLIMFSVLSTLFFYYKAGVPILMADKLEGRIEAYQQVTHYVIYLIRLIPIAFFFLFIYYSLKSHRNVRIKYWLILFFIYSFLVLLSTGSRTDVFFLLMVSLIIYNYVVKRVPLLKFASVSIVLVTLMLFYGYLRLVYSPGTEDSIVLLENIAGTNPFLKFLAYIAIQFSVYASNFSIVMDIFPDILPHTHGKLFLITLSTFLPGHQDTIGQIIKETLGLTFKGGGLNPTLLGEQYIDYGYVGIFIIMFIYGAVMRFLYRRVIKLPCNATNVLIYSYCYYALIISVLGGLFSQASRWYYASVIILVVFFSRAIKISATSCCKTSLNA